MEGSFRGPPRATPEPGPSPAKEPKLDAKSVAKDIILPAACIQAALPDESDHSSLAHIVAACWRHMRAIKRRMHPRGDLLIQLVPLGHCGGKDFVEQICDIAFDLRSRHLEDGSNLAKKCTSKYDKDLSRKTAHG